MFPADSHSMHQLHRADMHVAHQRRTGGTVVTPRDQRWYGALFAKLFIRRDDTSTDPITTAYARAQRRLAQSTTSFTLVDASTGQRLDD